MEGGMAGDWGAPVAIDVYLGFFLGGPASSSFRWRARLEEGENDTVAETLGGGVAGGEVRAGFASLGAKKREITCCCCFGLGAASEAAGFFGAKKREITCCFCFPMDG